MGSDSTSRQRAGTPPAVVAFVATHVIPAEPAARRWLGRQGLCPADCDDMVQEAYCRIAALADVGHIASPRGYLFQVLRNLLNEQWRRNRVVPLLAFTEALASSVEDEEPLADRIAAGRSELALVERLIAALPERCRQIFVWKRVEGLSQREIAGRLGVSETVVENDVMKGLRLILAGLARNEADAAQAEQGDADAAGRRQRA